MFVLLTTLMILTALAFASIVMVMTLVGSWNLVVSALRYEEPRASRAVSTVRTSGRPVTVSTRSPRRSWSVAA